MEFKYIFKVDHTKPEKTLEKLGQKVSGDINAFDGIDIDFVQNQDFITAVPVEIALTTELRANLLYHNPECRFVVTGVPVQRIKNLVEYGYTVFTHLDEDVETEEPVDGDGTEKDECEDKDEVKEEVKPVEEPKPAKRYWVNGEEATEEEFEEAAKKMKGSFKDMGFLFKEWAAGVGAGSAAKKSPSS